MAHHVPLSASQDKRSRYINKVYSKSVMAREIHIVNGLPSTKDFIRIISDKLFNNVPTSKQAIWPLKIFLDLILDL